MPEGGAPSGAARHGSAGTVRVKVIGRCAHCRKWVFRMVGAGGVIAHLGTGAPWCDKPGGPEAEL